MRVRRRTVSAAAVAIALAVGASAAPAFAGTAYGSWGYYGPQSGISYKNRNAIVTNPGSSVYGWTVAQTQSGANAPAGYMGVVARDFKRPPGDPNGAGALCAATDWVYSPIGMPAWSWNTSLGGCGSGAYYSQGRTAAWTGSSFNTYSTFLSPNQNF